MDNPAAPTIDRLPDEVLSRIMAQAGSRQPMLVSKRWHGIVLSEPELWRCLVLERPDTWMAATGRNAGAWFATGRSLLQRVGSMVQDVCVPGPLLAPHGSYDANGSPQRTADLLPLLRPASLRLGQPPAPESVPLLVAACGALTSLQLRLSDSPDHARAQEAVLQAPSQLHSLGITTPTARDWLLHAVVRHTGLQQLSLDAHLEVEPEAVHHLTQLQQLVSLTIRPGGNTQLPPPAAFPALAKLDYDTVLSRISVGGLELSQCTVKPRGELYLCRAAAEWPRRLPALLPPSFGALRSLELNSCEVEAASMGRLEGARWGLTRLHLFNCGQAASRGWFRLQPEALAALMDRAPALRDLSVRTCMLGEVPPCITQRRGLTSLCLEDNELKRLPRGLYLKTLASLNLDLNSKLPRLPMALKAATGLSQLSLRGIKHMELNPDLLAALPALSKVDVGSSKVPHDVLRMLRERLPQLVVVGGAVHDSNLDSCSSDEELWW